MELPIINRLSGTCGSDLLKDYLNAKEAVRIAIEVVSGVWPNGRDYQGGNIRQAMHEHADRVKRLRQVAAELETIAEGILYQLPEPL